MTDKKKTRLSNITPLLISSCLFSGVGYWQFHQSVSQNIIHVHALGPPLFVTDFSLVFQVSDNFCFSRQSPDQTASIRGWDSNWGFNFDIFRVNSCSCFIHQFNQLLKKRSKKVKKKYSFQTFRKHDSCPDFYFIN